MGKALHWQVYRMDERVRKAGFSSVKWMQKKRGDGGRRRRRGKRRGRRRNDDKKGTRTSEDKWKEEGEKQIYKKR